MTRLTRLAIAIAAVMIGGGQARGQTADSTITRVRPDGAILVPVILSYQATLQHGIDSKSLGERTVQLSRAIYAGAPAWELVETHGAGSTASVDTLIADFASLVALHWGATQQMPTSLTSSAAARVSIEFRADSMVGLITAPSGRRTIVAPMPGGSFLTAAHFETALRVLPFALARRDSVSIVVTDLAKSTIVAGELVVTGEERLLTQAGTFDCWNVLLATEVGQTQYWVAKADRIVVKTSQVLPESGDVLQYVLTRITH